MIVLKQKLSRSIYEI